MTRKKARKHRQIKRMASELGQIPEGYEHRRHRSGKRKPISDRKRFILTEKDNEWKKLKRKYNFADYDM